MYLGDCKEVMKRLPDNSVDSCVTDPPYELGFMGAGWDKSGIAYNVEMWKEVLRVLKPGAHLLAFSSTRTYHRMVCAIEDAGFEIRDQIGWMYGSGFPKSMDVSKAIDKAAGAEREVIGTKLGRPGMAKDGRNQRNGFDSAFGGKSSGTMPTDVTTPATVAAKQWDGWGTALKPAWEPICVARKPLAADTIAANVLAHGTGAININACRVGTEEITTQAKSQIQSLAGRAAPDATGSHKWNGCVESTHIGRWPANIIHDGSDEVLAEFAKYGNRSSGERKPGGVRPQGVAMNGHPGERTGHFDSSTGSAARFFYSAKASQSERNENGENSHSTVKPIALMEYLVTLVTPPGGLVLDPFAGSGSTGVAALRNKFRSVGIELVEAHFDIAMKRIADASRAAQGLSKQLSGQPSDYAELPMFTQEPA